MNPRCGKSLCISSLAGKRLTIFIFRWRSTNKALNFQNKSCHLRYHKAIRAGDCAALRFLGQRADIPWQEMRVDQILGLPLSWRLTTVPESAILNPAFSNAPR
jgi:hypothetical protein